MMRPGLRKFTLAAHLTFAVGWIGAAGVYLALAIVAARSSDVQTVRSAWVAMEVSGWYVIVPLAVASLVTGIVMAAGTRWGLFRHYWVIFSLVLTTFCVAVLVVHMPTVSSTADVARTVDEAALHTLSDDIAHPAIGLAILLAVQVLNVYKPRGVTRLGQRRLP